MKLLVLILCTMSVSQCVSYKCKEDDVMNNRSCWIQFSAVVDEYQNITMWLKPTQSSVSIVISDTLFALHNRTIKLGKSWFIDNSWNKIAIRVLIKVISKSKYELRYFIDKEKLEVSFPFESDSVLQPYFGLRWKFDGSWYISTSFPCLNTNFSKEPSSFNATNSTSVYNGTGPCSLASMSGTFPLNSRTDNNINKNCSCNNVTKSCLLNTNQRNSTQQILYNTTKPCPSCHHASPCPIIFNTTSPGPTCVTTSPCPTCVTTKPCPNIFNTTTICSTSNQTKLNPYLNITSCPNETTSLHNWNNLKNEENHAIIYVSLVFMFIGALSLVAGFLQYRKAVKLMKGGDYEEFRDDCSQIGALENDGGRISYGSNFNQRMQFNELVDKENLQGRVPDSGNARNYSISSELDADDVYNPMISPLSR